MIKVITQDGLFGVVVFESEDDLTAFQSKAGISDQRIIVPRVTRTIDPSFAMAK
jgi:hypothetical protein